MSDKLHFELVSPERLVMDVAVDSVRVPGTEGDFTVLPKHAPMMSTIRPGVIDVDGADGSKETQKIFIKGGFAEVTPDGLVILAEETIPVDELNRDDLEQRLKDAREDLADARDDDAQRLAQEAIDQLELLLKAVS